MLAKTEKEIPGLGTVRTTKLSVMRSLPMWVRVLNLVAPGLECLKGMDAGGLAAIKDAVDNENLTLAHLMRIAPALGPFFEKLDADIVVKLSRELLVATRVDREVNGKRVKIDVQGRDDKIIAAFGSNLGALLRTLWFVARINFEGFSAAPSDDTEDDGADEHSTSDT